MSSAPVFITAASRCAEKCGLRLGKGYSGIWVHVYVWGCLGLVECVECVVVWIWETVQLSIVCLVRGSPVSGVSVLRIASHCFPATLRSVGAPCSVKKFLTHRQKATRRARRNADPSTAPTQGGRQIPQRFVLLHTARASTPRRHTHTTFIIYI